jgi:hypothetical protein
MRPTLTLLCSVAVCLLLTSFVGADPAKDAPAPLPAPTKLSVTPPDFTIVGADNRQMLLITGPAKGQDELRLVDYSRQATYTTSDDKVAIVTSTGIVLPRGNGTADVRARFGDQETVAHVTVKDFEVEPRVSFPNQIVPLFSKHGCNAGGCHGKASGQNGFKLSLLGFDHRYDFAAVVEEARGRRIFPASPANSLLLLKGTGAVPHGGGKRLAVGTEDYDLMLRWIRQGTPPGSDKDPSVVRVECLPKTVVAGRKAEQQILVTAYYTDGTTRDVTLESQFKSNEMNLATVDTTGLVHTDINSGDTAIMARYMGQVSVCCLTIPLNDTPLSAKATDLPKHNYIDGFIQSKWRKLNVAPSPLADDATFIRRAYVDCIGTLPTPAEVRAFLDDNDAEKRSKIIDKLLTRGEYADYWAVKWGDILRNKRGGQGDHMRGTYAFHAWIRNALATNMPYDQFVRNIIAAQGTVEQHPPIMWYRTVRNLTHQTNDTAQLFLGTRINCAQCHHHPYEKWSQDDYYQFQAFFGRMGRKEGDIAQEPAIFVKAEGNVHNPNTGKVMQPRGLDGPGLTITEDEDPRQKLVDWMVEPKNPYFARALVNRYWAHFMGRGLVEPIDDMRATNPPSNPELLDALAQDFIEHKFDVKHLVRTIMSSTAYQLSCEPLPENVNDQQNYARAYPRRLTAEVMLDAINQVTGTMENFSGMPKGTRAIQLPDESVSSYFLDVFGRPTRETACECERPKEANLAQALHLLNSNDVQGKVTTATGRLATLLKDKKADADLLEELYLLTYSRRPTADEAKKALEYVGEQKDRKAAFEDVMWVLLNSKEFLFNH